MLPVWYKDTCVLQRYLCVTMIPVWYNDTCVVQRYLCVTMIPVWYNVTYVVQWYLCGAMIPVWYKDTCVVQCYLCGTKIPVLHLFDSLLVIWACRHVDIWYVLCVCVVTCVGVPIAIVFRWWDQNSMEFFLCHCIYCMIGRLCISLFVKRRFVAYIHSFYLEGGVCRISQLLIVNIDWCVRRICWRERFLSGQCFWICSLLIRICHDFRLNFWP